MEKGYATDLPEHEQRLALLGLDGAHPAADDVVLVVEEASR